MIAPVAKFIDRSALQFWWAIRLKSLRKRRVDAANSKLEEALQFLNGLNFIPVSRPVRRRPFSKSAWRCAARGCSPVLGASVHTRPLLPVHLSPSVVAGHYNSRKAEGAAAHCPREGSDRVESRAGFGSNAPPCPMKPGNVEHPTANSEQRTANIEQRTANIQQRTLNIQFMEEREACGGGPGGSVKRPDFADQCDGH